MAKVQATAQAPQNVTPITAGKRGRKPLPADPRGAFLSLVQGATGRVQRVLDSFETLGKVSVANYPLEPGNPSAGYAPVEYEEQDIDVIEAAIMKAMENCFTVLRNRPTSARAARSGFSL